MSALVDIWTSENEAAARENSGNQQKKVTVTPPTTTTSSGYFQTSSNMKEVVGSMADQSFYRMKFPAANHHGLFSDATFSMFNDCFCA